MTLKRSSRALFALTAGAAVAVVMTGCQSNDATTDEDTTTTRTTTETTETTMEPAPGAPGEPGEPTSPDDGSATIEIPTPGEGDTTVEIPTPDFGEPGAPEEPAPSPAP